MRLERDMLMRKVAGWQEAEEASNRLRARDGVPSPEQAVEAALELWDLRPDLFDLPRTESELADIASAASAWARLRATWLT